MGSCDPPLVASFSLDEVRGRQTRALYVEPAEFDSFGAILASLQGENTVIRTLRLRNPASITIATLLDRPYRRLVDELPVRYVGFTVPDELFVGYGFDLDERYRNLPDLHVLRSSSGST